MKNNNEYIINYDLDIVGEDFENLFPVEQIELSRICREEILGVENIIDGVNWYNHEEEMRELSKRHSGFVFKLSGEGEVPGDIWIKYFQNGKMQICRVKISFDKFDISKLK